jgi:uncharacterized membrane protein YeaQ/YmgE (transglycosylase-associated protein family)
MFAYLVAGLIVGGLAWVLTRRPGPAGLLVPLVVGTVAGALGGTIANLVHGAGIREVDAFGFTAAVLIAVLALTWIQVRRGHED